eukprot:TRINITY_DN3269_c0_g1_i6.p1 TRINITY_DN3269_c0_g1~~TRINITY_DN3269_c0_g1_i6.p1  ORF type:complete len:532 (-),score=121.07 TRINITY_DN3269_c0_g1_i6:292-1683(-)
MKAYYTKNRDHLRDYYRRKKKETSDKKKQSEPRKTRVWTDPKVVRTFFEQAAGLLHVHQPTDWYRVSRLQMTKVGGGGLYRVGHLGKALQLAFPEVDWDLSKFSFRGKKATQRWVRVLLQLLLPHKTDVVEDFLHPSLYWDVEAGHKMELDIWVPRYQLALEYQGEHHYHDLCSAYGPSGSLALYAQRDERKKQACREMGITLITVPYWWDGSKESLNATLYHIRPDVFQPTAFPAIPVTPLPLPKSQFLLKEDQISTFLMHGKVWNKGDPTGWVISEKLDGFRAFWDGTKLYSRNGNLISVPLDFLNSLPPGVCLDGELWIGYNAFSKLAAVLRKTTQSTDNLKKVAELWKEVKFCVFDAPMHPGNYVERHTFLRDTISGYPNHITLIPVIHCMGLKHLHTVLKEITKKKGEGIMLYHPEAKYTPGRTDHLYKVKAYSEEDVKFKKYNPNTYSFLCEQYAIG